MRRASRGSLLVQFQLSGAVSTSQRRPSGTDLVNNTANGLPPTQLSVDCRSGNVFISDENKGLERGRMTQNNNEWADDEMGHSVVLADGCVAVSRLDLVLPLVVFLTNVALNHAISVRAVLYSWHAVAAFFVCNWPDTGS